jgi:hypothetical protein
MANNKKGKKKAATAKETTPKPPSTAAAPQVANEISSFNDVSPLLFTSSSSANEKRLPKLPFVGPVTLIDQRNCNASEHQVVHGRGLVASRDISPGECLFVIPSIVSAPVDEVRRRFLELSSTDSGGNELEQITESVLVEQIQHLQDEEDDCEDREYKQIIHHSFLSQMSSDDMPQTNLDVVLAKSSNTDNQSSNKRGDTETILSNIRRNAFGPDYHNYDAIASWWLNNSSNSSIGLVYTRLLGIYPLAAMINHSCYPNAVRIFGTLPTSYSEATTLAGLMGREVMIVHASTTIKKGVEITWSYIPPTTPFNSRHELLRTKYGFSCQCVRCTNEQPAIASGSADLSEVLQQADDWSVSRAAKRTEHHAEDNTRLREIVQQLEHSFTSINGETQRQLRVGYASIYMEYFNAALSSPSIKSSPDEISNLLKLAMQLHFSFVSCNNASTEHLSILHLCYELSSLMHTRAMSYFPDTTNKTMSQVRFWTEQLKQAHTIRYGSLGGDLERVRYVMKHSRAVLRNRDGWYVVKDRFI